MGSYRTQQLNSQFREEISAIISRQLKNKCPNLSPIISVTEVDVSSDLSSAKVYVSIYDTDEERKKRSFKEISDSAGFIRSRLFTVLHLRTVPMLRFIEDGSMEYGAKINTILSNLDIPEAEEGDDEDDKQQ
ncbi:MAG: 30S ribosome-binding factor RbfA [Clostridia bacterium]|nr:30S ribosome-binding factor RbfA [Clostridia bacterium]